MQSLPDSCTFVSAAEAAFIAGVSDREVNRVIDDEIVPGELVERSEGRRIARLGAVFICLYYSTEPDLSAALRRGVLRELTDKLRHDVRFRWESVLRLDPAAFKDTDTEFAQWVTHFRPANSKVVQLDMHDCFEHAFERASAVDNALAEVSTDAGIMGGVPVFKGSRVPIDTVLASIDKGITLSRLQESWPFLTEARVAAARVYTRVRPRVGRPRKLSEDLPKGWTVEETKVVRPPRS